MQTLKSEKSLPPAEEILRRLRLIQEESRELKRLLRTRQSIDRADAAREARHAS